MDKYEVKKYCRGLTERFGVEWTEARIVGLTGIAEARGPYHNRIVAQTLARAFEEVLHESGRRSA